MQLGQPQPAFSNHRKTPVTGLISPCGYSSTFLAKFQ